MKLIIGFFLGLLMATGLVILVRWIERGPYTICSSSHLDTLQVVENGNYVHPYIAYVCDKVVVHK